MPIGSLARSGRLAAKLRPTDPSQVIRPRLREYMARRASLRQQLLEHQECHPEVFDRFDELQSDIADLDTAIKDLVRTLYQEGSQRGINTLYEDSEVYVKATIKYGKDVVDEAAFAQMWDDSELSTPESYDEDLVVVTREVNVKKLRALVKKGVLPDSLLDAIHTGAFHTPSVTIKSKIEGTIVEEEEQ